ncbi:hypothetical protein I79_025630 [Cricetulus griseus]|uniref:Uncharacterized protein n=1 Tax=Cricetulus griseus TaxID=10029 RepID=G3INU0_CRIGR|nr:hypothetical protein I79_025630 [Cricetulus griseus]
MGYMKPCLSNGLSTVNQPVWRFQVNTVFENWTKKARRRLNEKRYGTCQHLLEHTLR